MAVQTPAPERAAGRRSLAKAKKALPDGSFPIPNVSYLKKAIRAVGRAAPGKRPALARLIRKRAHQLGQAGMAVLKGSWADSSQSATSMANALRAQLIECGYSPEQAALELTQTMPLLVIDLAGYSDGDNDADDKGKKSVDMLSPKGKAVMKRLVKGGMDAKKAYNIACYHTPGGMAKQAA